MYCTPLSRVPGIRNKYQNQRTRRRTPGRDAARVIIERIYLGISFEYLKPDGDEWISVLHEQFEYLASLYCFQHMLNFFLGVLHDTALFGFLFLAFAFKTSLSWYQMVNRMRLGSNVRKNQDAVVDGFVEKFKS